MCLKIRKHLLRWHPAANDSVNMRCAYMDSMSKPAPVFANTENRLEREWLGFFVKNPGRLLQMYPPIRLAEGISGQYRTAKGAMLLIHPTLFRTRKVGAVGRKSY